MGVELWTTEVLQILNVHSEPIVFIQEKKQYVTLAVIPWSFLFLDMESFINPHNHVLCR